MRKACFLTFDNTLITTLSGRKYPLHGEDWKFINNTLDLIEKYYNKDYLICVLINQSEINKGIISEALFKRKIKLVLTTLQKNLKAEDYKIKVHICTNEEDYNFLPKVGMIYELALQFKIDVVNSILLGSSELLDKEILKNSGIKNYKNIIF